MLTSLIWKDEWFTIDPLGQRNEWTRVVKEMLGRVLQPFMDEPWAVEECKVMHEIVIGWLAYASVRLHCLDDDTKQTVDMILKATRSSVEIVLERLNEVMSTAVDQAPRVWIATEKQTERHDEAARSLENPGQKLGTTNHFHSCNLLCY